MSKLNTLNAQVFSLYLRNAEINTRVYPWLNYNNSSPILRIKEYYSHTYKSMVGAKFVLLNQRIYICHDLIYKPIRSFN